MGSQETTSQGYIAIFQFTDEQTQDEIVEASHRTRDIFAGHAGDWSADQVHLNSRGHFKFTKALVDVLEKHMGIAIGQPEMS